MRDAIDTSKLPPEQARDLESLVTEAAFFDIPARVSVAPENADRFTYKITVESAAGKHTVETGDEEAPDTLKPLLRRLTVLARSAGRSQT